MQGKPPPSPSSRADTDDCAGFGRSPCMSPGRHYSDRLISRRSFGIVSAVAFVVTLIVFAGLVKDLSAYAPVRDAVRQQFKQNSEELSGIYGHLRAPATRPTEDDFKHRDELSARESALLADQLRLLSLQAAARPRLAWIWLLMATNSLLMICLSLYFIQLRRGRRRRAAGLCVACGYDLRASKERCPECGTPISANAEPLLHGWT